MKVNGQQDAEIQIVYLMVLLFIRSLKQEAWSSESALFEINGLLEAISTTQHG